MNKYDIYGYILILAVLFVIGWQVGEWILEALCTK